MKTKKQSFTNIDITKPGPNGEVWVYVPGAKKMRMVTPRELEAFLLFCASKVRPHGIYAIHNDFYYEIVNEVCNTEEEFQQKCAEYLRIGFKVHHTCSKWKMTDSDN